MMSTRGAGAPGSTPHLRLTDKPLVSYLIIGGMIVCAWAMLNVVGSEFVRRQREFDEAQRPKRPAAPAQDESASAVPVVPLAKPMAKIPSEKMPPAGVPAPPRKSR